MVEYNIDNTIIKSFSLQCASIGLDGIDFPQLEVATSSLLGTLKHLLVVLTLPRGAKIGQVIHFYTEDTQPDQKPAVAMLHLQYGLSLIPQASSMNSSVLLG